MLIVKVYYRNSAFLSGIYFYSTPYFPEPDNDTWIQGPSTKWKTFVGNRVALLQENTAAAKWRHVPTSSNPADFISRGIETTALSTSTL